MVDFVAVIATHGSEVLLAQSGKWAQDQAGLVPNVHAEQRYMAPADTPANKAAAIAKFTSFASANNLNVGQITWKPADKHAGSRYATKFILREPAANRNPPGFIKGTVSPRTRDPRILRQKAIEEFKEEVGIQLADADLVGTAEPNVFIVDMALKGAKEVAIDAWNALGPMTEVVQLQWVRKAAVPPLNPQSESVRGHIPMPGGRRIRASTSRKRRSRRSLRRRGGTQRRR